MASLRYSLVAIVITLYASLACAAEPLKITVYGASGMFGSGITHEALSRGHYVTGVTRNPAKIEITHKNLSTAKGDVTESDTVAKQISGQDVVICAVRSKNSPDGNPDPKQSVEYRAAVSLIEATRSLGEDAPRLVFVGGGSTLEVEPGVTMLDKMIAEDRLPPGSIGAMFLGHNMLLEMLRATDDIKWTVLSPSANEIEKGNRTGKFQIGSDTLLKDANGKSAISVEDFSIAMVDELEEPKHIRKRFTVAH